MKKLPALIMEAKFVLSDDGEIHLPGDKPKEKEKDTTKPKEKEKPETVMAEPIIKKEHSKKIEDAIEELADAAEKASIENDIKYVRKAYDNYLDALRHDLSYTEKEVIKNIIDSRKMAQQAILTAETEQMAREYKMSVQLMTDKLKELNVKI